MATFYAKIDDRKLYRIVMVVATAMCGCSSTNADFDTEVANRSAAVLGGVAHLPCYTKPPSPDASVSIIMWYNIKSPKPICSFDNREENSNTVRYWYDKAWFGSTNSTFRFSEAEQFSILTLKSIRLSDEGLYRCRVDFKKSPTRNYVVNLTVIIPPRKLSIIEEKGTEMSNPSNNVIGPYNEGSTVFVTCAAYGGSPASRVTWWKENALLDGSSEHQTDGSVRNVLKLEKLTRGDLNAVYTCQATNNNISVPLSTTVTITMNLSPLWVKLQGANKPMSAGRTYEISCQVYGANPSPVVTWWKENVKIKNYEKSDSNDGNSTISRLNFIPEVEDDGKNLSCRAESPVPSSVALQDSWKLNITYKPTVTLQMGQNLNSSAIVEGADVYFECKIKSNLPVEKIGWKHGDKFLRHNHTVGLLLTGHELVLQRVTRLQSGFYSCLATNAEGDAESNPAYLDVKFAPVCYLSGVQEYGVGLDETKRVKCEFVANPAHNVTFTWRFNNTSSSADLPHSRHTANGTRSYAEIQPKSQHDYGILSCWARNVLGESKEPCLYKIFPAGKPDAVANCTVANKTLNSFHIRCASSFDGGSKQTFAAEIYEAQTNILYSNLSSELPAFEVNNLEAGWTYNVILYAFNANGRSRTVEFTEKLEEPQIVPARWSPLPDLPPVLTMLMMLIGVLIFLTCCIVITMKSRRRRSKKNFAYKSKESLEKNPDIIPDKDDVTCMIEVVNVNDEKKSRLTKETDISLILQNSYSTDLNSDFTSQPENCKKTCKKKTSSLKKLNEIEITYAACDQPCPPFVTQDTPLISSNKTPLVNEGQHSVRCCIHGLSRSTSISRF